MPLQQEQEAPAAPWQAPAPAELAAELPAYEVEHLIAIGGMGAVYRGRHRALDRPAAIKVLAPRTLDNAEIEAERLFLQEARAMARLTHPAVVQVHDFGTTAGGLAYLVMEYIDGSNVEQLLRERGALPEAAAVRITQKICDGLTAAHDQGLLHGDVKPANILLDQSGRVCLTDLGLARGLQEAKSGSAISLGTPGYAAPELYQSGAGVDHRSDVYALGATLYEMLTGYAPEHPSLSPQSIRPDVSIGVNAAVVKATQPMPGQRYHSAAAFKTALASAPARHSPAHSPALASPPAFVRRPLTSSAPVLSQPRRPAAMPWSSIAAATVVIAAVIGGLKWKATQDQAARSAQSANGVTAERTDEALGAITADAVPDTTADSKKDAAAKTSAPAASDLSSTAPPPVPAEVTERLADLERKFATAVESKVEAPHAAEMAQLNANYAGALQRALTAAQQAGRFEDIAAIHGEQSLLAGEGIDPGMEPLGLAPVLEPLRATYRGEAAQRELQRLRNLDGLFGVYQQTLSEWRSQISKEEIATAGVINQAIAGVAKRQAAQASKEQMSQLAKVFDAYQTMRGAVASTPTSDTPAASSPVAAASSPPQPAAGANLGPIRLESRFSSGKSDRLSRNEMFDDRSVRITPTMDIVNRETARDLQGAKGTLVTFARSVLDGRDFQVLGVDTFDLNVLRQASARVEGKAVSYEFDDTGAAQYGYKYHGYCFIVQDATGVIIYSAATPASWGEQLEKVLTLRGGMKIDRDLKAR